MRKVHIGFVLGAVLAASFAPTVASAHRVHVGATGEFHALHSGPITPPAHTGGLLVASEAVDGTADGVLNVGQPPK